MIFFPMKNHYICKILFVRVNPKLSVCRHFSVSRILSFRNSPVTRNSAISRLPDIPISGWKLVSLESPTISRNRNKVSGNRDPVKIKATFIVKYNNNFPELSNSRIFRVSVFLYWIFRLTRFFRIYRFSRLSGFSGFPCLLQNCRFLFFSRNVIFYFSKFSRNIIFILHQTNPIIGTV